MVFIHQQTSRGGGSTSTLLAFVQEQPILVLKKRHLSLKNGSLTAQQPNPVCVPALVLICLFSYIFIYIYRYIYIYIYILLLSSLIIIIIINYYYYYIHTIIYIYTYLDMASIRAEKNSHKLAPSSKQSSFQLEILLIIWGKSFTHIGDL